MQPSLVIDSTTDTPALHVYVNPMHALYQYLATQAQAAPDRRHPATAAAASLMQQARWPRGVHGPWDEWEVPLTTAREVTVAVVGFKRAMAATADLLGEALALAEPVWHETLWPERLPAIAAALATLASRLAPHWPTLCRRQAAQLDLCWPEQIEAFLVAECYGIGQAYSHPLTISALDWHGLELCEGMLHEATHVADVHTSTLERTSLRDRLLEPLTAGGMPYPRAWQAWHAVIFASAAQQVREVMDPSHVDYAQARGLYGRALPAPPAVHFGAYVHGEISQDAYIQQVVQELLR